MKKLLFGFSLALFTAAALNAQELSREERDKAIQYLEKTRTNLLAATKGLSEAQWTFKPATNRWSVAEVTEHIAAAEDMLLNLVRDKVMTAPARTGAEDVKAIDEFILANVPDRTRKAQAPEPLQPSNRFGSPAESLKHFEESRAKTIDFLKQTKDLRAHAMEAPIGKTLDGYQWMLFIAAHSDRHTKQLNEVKADPNFPRE